MKTLIKPTLLLLLMATAVFGKVPRGFKPTSEFEAVKAEAIEKKKLLTIVFKGSDDRCPNCAATMENGEKATKSSSKLLFTRVSAFRNKKTGLPEEILSQVGSLADGASVYFYVFNPNDLKLVTKGSRTELQSNKKTIREFKNTVRAAKKEL
ncbi:hypothetical protein JIN77_10120 [Verrucomicrobiaceae bacterium R5-34]|uniref:Thioredoxin domain-containing protein n=1 Tax=Oceaniferula flava TaxID=2800421 RepID=A0AAE2V9R3_9BACT|nr:hypothetical protein [Oceaniferula flavus]MBK1831082.1 hypothetical protein [Verrucomicrobiaceae bacterium R5-34]MBK1855598.1 hypothetical protein [Oceaniferula flavus]MBM1136904.1 hypothetical protein [Oceaniferula flavus]